jgi:hypothetical protein
MIFPKNAADFVNDAEKFSGSPLNKKAELILLVEEAEQNGKSKVFEDLIFNAKYIMSLIKTIERSSPEVPMGNMEHMKKDFSAKLLKTSDLLKQILSLSAENIRNHFETSYFGPPEESLYNLNLLLSDLERIQNYVNEKKRKDAYIK